MSQVDEIWLVAGGEPGAERFGQLVQLLRKEKRLSVEELATQADLSVGTIRAIEQGRRAPSEESGVRLLQLLLPLGSLSKEKAMSLDGEQIRIDYSFIDPQSGTRVLLQFRAKTAGDNRRWSIDKPRAGESKAEAFIRELWSDPKRRAEWQETFSEGIRPTLAALADLRSWAAAPASDAAFGRVMRRLATTNGLRMELLENLLALWHRVESDTAGEWERSLASQMDTLLAGYYKFPDDDVPLTTE
ncbi:helix-turn-helix domain-containing protein [Paenarthrobacter nitroguajacolicus]|uniref:helix-turn-helix domain-containing protein n=1 Tax=Paenarthrobacter nitroguajacolicus TaxID=211146 RepID=UPI00248A9F3A|nr:helix-turn-helix transcriptional regulator [Paenarthrobacter nitroguajacolicus]